MRSDSNNFKVYGEILVDVSGKKKKKKKPEDSIEGCHVLL